MPYADEESMKDQKIKFILCLVAEFIAATHSYEAKAVENPIRSNPGDFSPQEQAQELAGQKLINQADEKLKSGDVDEAIALLEKYIRQYDPFDKTQRARLVEILVQSKSFQRAEDHLAVLERMDEYSLPVRISKAKLFMEQNRFSEALATLEKPLLNESLPTEYMPLKAAVLNSLNRFDDAGEISRKVLAVDPKSPLASLTLAESELGKGRKKEAFEIAHKYSQNLHASIDWEIRAARLYLTLEDYRAARDYFARALKLSPSRVDLGIEKARCSLQIEDWNLALDELNGWLKRYPDHDRVVFWVGKTYTAMKQYSKAGVLLRDYIAKYPDRSWAIVAYSKILVMADRSTLASEILSQALENKPESIDIAAEYSRVLGIIGKSSEALSLLEKYSKSYPNNAYIKVAFGDLFASLGDRAQALAYYRMVRSSDPQPYKLASQAILALETSKVEPSSTRSPAGIR